MILRTVGRARVVCISLHCAGSSLSKGWRREREGRGKGEDPFGYLPGRKACV